MVVPLDLYGTTNPQKSQKLSFMVVQLLNKIFSYLISLLRHNLIVVLMLQSKNNYSKNCYHLLYKKHYIVIYQALLDKELTHPFSSKPNSQHSFLHFQSVGFNLIKYENIYKICKFMTYVNTFLILKCYNITSQMTSNANIIKFNI